MLGNIVQTKQFLINVDEEVCETAQVYVDYVRSRLTEGTTLFIEQAFSLESLDPPFEAGGTGDAVILNSVTNEIEIVDLKGGRGVVVEALENKQLRTYALGAFLAHPGAWRTVRTTIVQPRAPHQAGRTRSEVFSTGELIEWTFELREAMELAAQADRERGTFGWVDTYLKPGDHCHFCKASARCPALASRALAEAHSLFEPVTEDVRVPPAPTSLTIPQLVKVLDSADMIGNWLNAVRAHAHSLVELGHAISDGTSSYELVPKRASRKWTDAANAEMLALLANCGADVFYQEPKLLTPTQVEKLLGKKGYEAVAGLVTKESSGVNLTRVAAGATQTMFSPE